MKSNYLGWLAFENCRGGNVYFSINPLVPGATRRTKDAVAEAKGLYLDLDSDGDAKLAAIRRSENVPQPNAVIQTSTGKYQVLWRVHGFTIPEQEAMLKDPRRDLRGRPRLHRLRAGVSPPRLLQSQIHSGPSRDRGNCLQSAGLLPRRFQNRNAGRLRRLNPPRFVLQGRANRAPNRKPIGDG